MNIKKVRYVPLPAFNGIFIKANGNPSEEFEGVW